MSERYALISTLLNPEGLSVVPVPRDGDCLFHAIVVLESACTRTAYEW